MTRIHASLLLVVWLASQASAEPPHHDAACPAPGCDKTLVNRHILLVPKEEAITVPKLTLREVEAGVLRRPELDFVEEKRTVTEMRLETCEVEQKVVCTEMKAVKTTDPCTGKCHTDYHPCEVVKTVKVKVYKPVPVKREVVVRVPVLKEGPPLSVRKLVLDETTVPAIKTTYGMVETISEIKVPVPPPPPPPPPPPCPHGKCLPH